MLSRIDLSNFRGYERKSFEFVDGVNVIFGKNAVGKTNVLEGIYLCGVGESFRAKRTEEMVRFGLEMGRVKTVVLNENDEIELEVLVSNGIVLGKRVNKRKYLVNGAAKRKKDILGYLPVVLFRPEDVELVTGSPDERRKFLDRLISQASVEYANSLSVYEQALRQRNKILDAIREGQANKYSLTFWDGLMIKHGNIITNKRRETLEYINDLFAKSELFNKLKLDYDSSTISESRLMQYKDAELGCGYTLVGPHKDDVLVKDEGRNLAMFGSRGEQRMAVLAMKMGEIYFLEDEVKMRALLLLDDVFSELDEIHKQEVLRLMRNRQVVVTTADESDLNILDGASVMRVS